MRGDGSAPPPAEASCDSTNPRQWWEQHYVMKDVYWMVNKQNKRALDSNMKGDVYTSPFSDSNQWMKWYIPYA